MTNLKRLFRKRRNNTWERIKRTSSDLTTLEINTIVKTDMNCLKPTDNDRLALYQLASKYHTKLVNLGSEYYNSITSADFLTKQKESFDAEKEAKGGEISQSVNVESHLFRRVPHYVQGGIVSFVELANVAKKAKRLVLNNLQYFSREESLLNNDISIITRIELKSLEMVSVLADLVGESDKATYNSFWQAYETNGSDHFSYLDKLHDILLDGVKLDERSRASFLNKDNFIIDLDLRDKILVRKALDLGTERVLMQTRIGLDGDITTRIAEKFADKPEQFILDIHNDSIQTSIDYWTKLVDILVSFGKNILKYFKK
ncbi:MAG: hypothetical protein N4A71_09890 [Carboxylicivirga sp.]|jgi:hypothetical protein|nr:hypothetical protein [Carboxylicivirga sp.]